MAPTPLQVIALAKVVKQKSSDAARDELDVGVHQVDLVARVKGTITVGPDTERVPTASIPVKEVLALLVQRAGALRGNTIALIRDCLTEALSEGVKGQGSLIKEFDAHFGAEIDRVLASLPTTPVRGAVQTALELEVEDGALIDTFLVVNGCPRCPARRHTRAW